MLTRGIVRMGKAVMMVPDYGGDPVAVENVALFEMLGWTRAPEALASEEPGPEEPGPEAETPTEPAPGEPKRKGKKK
jgi:hypothetical protein